MAVFKKAPRKKSPLPKKRPEEKNMSKGTKKSFNAAHLKSLKRSLGVK